MTAKQPPYVLEDGTGRVLVSLRTDQIASLAYLSRGDDRERLLIALALLNAPEADRIRVELAEAEREDAEDFAIEVDTAELEPRV